MRLAISLNALNHAGLALQNQHAVASQCPVRKLWIAVSLAVVLTLGACASDQTFAPRAPTQSAVQQQFHALAFTADIDRRTGRVTIASPRVNAAGGPTLSTAGGEVPGLSLLGGDAVRLVPSNYRASAVGAFAPNKIRVSFDLTIENKLPGVALVTPTWPVPPASGIALLPLDNVVTTTAGGVTGQDGSTVIVEQPSLGRVEASIDWNGSGAPGSGSPYNFFNDTDCAAATSNDCFRWELFDPLILPVSGSTTRTVGFDIDASVGQFRTRLIVAADLASAGSRGTVTGLVTSSADGLPIAGAEVRSTSGASARTDAAGRYTLRSAAGSLTVSDLYAGCVAPRPSFISESATPRTVDVVATCPTPPRPGYQLSVVWSTAADGLIEAELRLDMRTYNRPDIGDISGNGVTGDPMTVIQLALDYDPSQLVFVTNDPVFPNLRITQFNAVPGAIRITGSSPVPVTGNLRVARFAFMRSSGAMTGAALTSILNVAGAFDVARRIDSDVVPISVPFVFSQPRAPQSLVAEANGPYSVDVDEVFWPSSAGSSVPTNSPFNATGRWALDGSALTFLEGQTSFSFAGTFQLTLTITDRLGRIASDRATLIVAPPPPPSALPTWTNTFGEIDSVARTVTMNAFMDIRADLPESVGLEALERLVLDSLAWDPEVLELIDGPITSGFGGSGTASRSSISVSSYRPNGVTGRIMAVALRFRIIGETGASTTTRTRISSLLGPEARGSFSYLPVTRVIEGAFTVP